MIGEIQTHEIDGKSYDISKQGVSMAMEIESIFKELVVKSDIERDSDLPDDKIGIDLMIGMRGKIVLDVKRVVMACTEAPKLTKDSYEELSKHTVPTLFLKIYYQNAGEPEKKSEQPTE